MLFNQKYTPFAATKHVFWAPKYTLNVFAAGALPWSLLGKLTVLPQTP